MERTRTTKNSRRFTREAWLGHRKTVGKYGGKTGLSTTTHHSRYYIDSMGHLCCRARDRGGYTAEKLIRGYAEDVPWLYGTAMCVDEAWPAIYVGTKLLERKTCRGRGCRQVPTKTSSLRLL